MTIEFRVLGEIAVLVDGRPLTLGHARQRSVLAALLADVNRSLTLDQLVDRVWGERAPKSARDTLYGYLSRLRAALPAPVAIHRDRGYRLEVDPSTVDFHRFRGLVAAARSGETDQQIAELFESALELWRGDPFPDLDSQWSNEIRGALQHEYLAVKMDRVDCLLRLGRHNELLPQLAASASSSPLDERIAGQLMRALYRSGRRADALDVYRCTRERLTEELGTDPGNQLRELHRRILAADPALAANAVARTAHPVPRQLPAPPRVFTGRAEQLAVLDRVLDPAQQDGPTAVVSAIGGAGGVGKTSLALHWAYQNADRFPDGQLHVNLRGFDRSGVPELPARVLLGFLRALGVASEAIPADLDGRAALYRSLLSGKRMLVVLDNAHDTDQVEPLLPGSAGCAVLITSRSHLAGVLVRGASLLNLEVMPPDEAHDLLTRHLGAKRAAAEPDAVRELLRYCAGLPLAISIVATRAAAHPDFPLSPLVDELRDASARLDALDAGDLATDLRTVLSWSYQALPDEARRIFGLLGLTPTSEIGLDAAASLLELPPGKARVRLRALEDVHLLQQPAPGRYRMHDLVRLYAAERVVPAEDRAAALRRLVDYYLHTAHQADAMLNPHRRRSELAPPADGVVPPAIPDQRAAFRWFDAEHPQVLAAQDIAVDGGWDTQAWQLAWVLNGFHRRRGHLKEDRAVWRTGVAAADRAGETTPTMLAYSAAACSALAEHGAALAELSRGLAMAEQSGDLAAQANTHLALAIAWERKGDDERALIHSEQALRLQRAGGDHLREATTINSIGWFNAKLGRYSLARDYCQRALTLARERDEREEEANTLDSLGYIAAYSGHPEEALTYYQAARDLYRKLGHVAEEAEVLRFLGGTHRDLGNFHEAAAVWSEALAYYDTRHRSDQADQLRCQLAELPDGVALP
ncbi:AfsR/SARP family transcriptional regulator [Amycolatopsis taiwanensis]|uniref:SARP family transcriptional regulator n=1 Tax=Amycolatopsis taiwanensis TaxID=342230 RepID=A0A9W6R7I9_9PSEU|nr:BTAD domain-containing putative transcriptional regulator [Amycolatopsis taiwanensis]GLY70826.1 hypothetical protein Atai01_74450 [Amycolatopsis taiwanensis]